MNQIYIDQLLDVSDETHNESLNLSIEIDDNNILYLSPSSPQQQQQQTTQKDDKNNTNTSLLDTTNDITLTPSTSFLQLDISNHDNEEMNVLECSEITLGSSFLIEVDSNDMNINSDMAEVDRSLSSRLDVSDNSDEFEIVMNEQTIKREVAAGAIDDEVSNVSIDTSIDEQSILDGQQNTSTKITCDEFITEALQTSFIENVKLGYNVVTNKLEMEFIDMGFADCISG